MNFYVDVGEPDEVSAIIDEMKEKKIYPFWCLHLEYLDKELCC